MKILVSGHNENIWCVGDKDTFKPYYTKTFHNNILFARLNTFVTFDYVSRLSFLYLTFDKNL